MVIGIALGRQGSHLGVEVEDEVSTCVCDNEANVTTVCALRPLHAASFHGQCFSAQTAPEPIDERVKLREVAGRTLAAIRYSGFWSQANDAEHLGQLTAALRTAELSWAGEPVVARYNGPWTPWFLRRNELWLQLP